MRILKITLIILLLIPNLLFADDQFERNEITKNLRCLICQGQSVYDSDSDFANSMKILVDKKLEEGLSEKEIYIYFKEKYGDWILYDPGLNKNTYLLWLLPILIFLFGGAPPNRNINIGNNHSKYVFLLSPGSYKIQSPYFSLK